MNRRTLAGLAVTAAASIVVAAALVILTDRLPLPSADERAEQRISEVRSGPDLVKKELLVDQYRKHLAFEEALRARDLAYVGLVRTLCLVLVLLALVQLYLLVRLRKGAP